VTVEHVEVRVLGSAAAAAAVLSVLHTAGDRRVVAGPGAGRGPYSRSDGRVAFYGHLQVDVSAPAGPPTGRAALCPEPGCGRRIGLSRHGLISTHYKGAQGPPVRCPGTGQQPAEDGADA
jgi:hypothetical protein